MPSNHLILCCPLLLQPSIFPSIRVFSNESAVQLRWPKYWSFSLTSVLSKSIQGWFHLRLTGLISLLSKGLSRIFSSTTIWKQQFLALSLLYGPTLTSVHDYMKNHSFDYMDHFWQSNVSAFSNAWKWKVKVKLLSHVWLFANPWIANYQAPPSMGFSRQEYWSGVPSPSLP